jgi:iron complex outermembrane receptor protein
MYQLRRKPASTLTIAVISAVILFLVTPDFAFADQGKDIADMDLQGLLDDIVLSASKHEETLEESPANVFIISRKEIENYGCRNIGEALSLVPGLYITDDYSLSMIGVRGTSFFGDWNSRVMVLLDGRSITEQYSGTNSIDVSGLDIDNVDRIEVIKGPSSSLYGSNAFFGIVNLITEKPVDNSLSYSSKYFSDTKFFGNSIRLHHKFSKDLSINLTGSWIDRGGNDLFFEEFSDFSDGSLWTLDEDGYNQFYLDSADFTGGYSREKNSLENFSTHSTIDWKNFYMTFHLARQNTGISHGFYGALFNRPENNYRERAMFLDFGYQADISSNADLFTRVSYSRNEWSDHILYNYYSEEDDPWYLPGPVWVDYELDRSFSSEARLRVNLSDMTGIVIGAETQFHKIIQESGESDKSGDEVADNIITPENVEHTGQIYNLYSQYEHRFSRQFKAVGGLHFNYYSYMTGKVMPKGALIFNPYASGTYKLIASRGFRSPTFYEITFDDGDYFIGNPDLDPELITSYEMISAHELPYGVLVEVAANHSRINDLILQTVIDESDPAHPGGVYLEEISQFRNVGKMRSNSLEFSLRRNPIYRLSGFANVTYQKLEVLDDKQSNSPFNSPRWLGNAGVTYQVMPSKLFVSTKANYISSRRLWDDSFVNDQITVDLYTRVNELLGFLDITAGISNLFDESNRVPLSYDYAPSTSIERPGRSLYLNLRTTADW